jgi:acyl carrier protein
MKTSVYENEEKLLEQLIDEVKKFRSDETVTAESTLTDLGIDSLNVIELVMICESIYNQVKNPDALKFDEFTTLKDLHDQLIELSN